MKVQCIAQTTFMPPEDVPWAPDEPNSMNLHNGSQLVEFAGRACYQSWSRPNPKTATNEGYIRHILDVGHFSVLEHSSVTFYIEGVSRSLTHELVRHRHFSYSQLSQRYVDESDTEFVTPPLIEPGSDAELSFARSTQRALADYVQLVADLTRQFPDLSRKEIRQAARSVLPNATETKIVVTGNYRAWWDMLLLRATPAADVEIRELAIMILKQLQLVAPHVFSAFTIEKLDDGTEVAFLNYDDAAS